ncbi:MAG: hypothetical protein RR357_00955 [Clostridia bacterium]
MANSFWNEIKKLFKSKQTIAEEEAQKIGSALAKEQSIVDILKDLENQYQQNNPPDKIDDGKFPDEIKLSRIDYKPKSDEEIKKIAESEFANQYKQSISKIDQKILDKAVELNRKGTTAEEEKRATQKEIDALFESLKEGAGVDAIKRGVQRSSIITERLKDYDMAKASNIVDTEKAFKNVMESITSELSNLEVEREKALENLDLSLATKVTEKIANLSSERDKLQNEAIIKNNQIAEREVKLNEELDKDKLAFRRDQENMFKEKLAEQNEYEKEHGYSGEKLENYSNRYNVALEFYLTLDPDIALKALDASGSMKNYLGNYYDKLHGVLEERGRHTNKKI